MNRAELIMAMAVAHKNWRKRDTAFLSDGLYIDNIGEQSATHTYDTPVVNILQNLSVSQVKTKFLFCTYPPSEMDLGMACMREIDGAFYLRNGTLYYRSVNQGTGVGAEQVPANGWEKTTVIDTFERRRDPIDNTVPNWRNTAWVDNFYQELGWLKGKRDLGDTAFKLYNSYQKHAEDGISQRPKNDIDEAEKRLKKGLDILASWVPAPISQQMRDKLFMVLAYAIVGRSLAKKDDDRTTSLPGGHNVGAVLLDAVGKPLAWGVNMKDLNGTFHAETALILSYLRRNNLDRLPDGCHFFSTLKPCHMCAGFIATVAKDITVTYGQDDPLITGSALDRGRGDGAVQQVSTISIPSVADLVGATLPGGKVKPVSDVLRELHIKSHSLGVISFLYSKQAKSFFETVRRHPPKIKSAMERFKALPLTSSQVTVQTHVPQKHSLRLRGLDLAGLPETTTTRGPMVPIGNLTGSDLQYLESVGPLEFGLVRRQDDYVIQGLDLFISGANPEKRRTLRKDHYGIDHILDTLGLAQQFLDKLEAEGILTPA